MAEQAKPAVAIMDWPGMVQNQDPKDIEPGAAEIQINACSFRYGELVVRHGIREVTFES